ncbi:probable aspergillopepsin A precursor [Rhynchosporium agropyri]|uniref:Probable aspergillopepsin A n=1 Tax=Rhynchosporium agropyri TaxID=914238 RepID=A0A1E1JTU1_9HELO|nr:probable aspergillopepsin A precursor [Rhynchosporium agropyri]
MPSIIQLQALLLLALVSFALAVPTKNAPVKKRSFKVERVVNPDFKGRAAGAGTRALVKAHRKYGVALPQGLVDAMNAASAANTDSAGIVAALSNTASVQSGELAGGVKGKAAQGAGAGTGTGTGTGKGSGSGAASAPRPKTTGNAPAGSTNGTSAGGVVTATPEKGDVEYLSPVSIGNQTILMNFDTGSADLWVFSTQLAPASQVGHTAYDASKSTRVKAMTGSTWSISYGDGSGAKGTVVTDTVNIGGASVRNQAVEIATAVSQSFVQDANSNGLVGLAYSKLNTVKPAQQKTFFDNAMPGLAMPVFTADLRKAAVGSYEFGNIDSSKFNGSLTWANVNTTQGFWQFSSNKFQVGTGAPMTIQGGQAIADTGTTLMLANPAIVNAYYSQVKGAVNDQTVGGVTFPCKSQLPDLAVDVGGSYMATVRGSDINFAPVDASGTMCFGGLQGIASNLQIYGDIMFKSQFVAFNGGNNSIGMAPHQ